MWEFRNRFERLNPSANLASNLLQLQNTLWLGRYWKKRAVHFTVQTSVLASDISADTSTPFILSTFPNSWNRQQVGGRSDAKSALLELDILLLEIWHETCFEAGYPNAPAITEYKTRFELAWEWLECVNNPPPDLYGAATSQCVKHFFGGRPVSFEWDDINFRKSNLLGHH
jgi:hypothetical protein